MAIMKIHVSQRPQSSRGIQREHRAEYSVIVSVCSRLLLPFLCGLCDTWLFGFANMYYSFQSSL